MKRIILSLLLLATGIFAFAQKESNYATTSTGSYPAYNAPNNIRMNFQAAYPNATNVTWQPMNEGWRATYTTSNRLIHVYYNQAGTNYTVALPAIETQIPEDVITKAISQYGNNIYDITMMKSANNVNVYGVRLAENGNIKSAWMNADGSVVSDVYLHK
jgi:DNA-binding helix-hairpin-helix protein with protein kinase domain